MFPIEVGGWGDQFEKARKKYGEGLLGVGGMDKTALRKDKEAVDREIERMKRLASWVDSSPARITGLCPVQNLNCAVLCGTDQRDPDIGPASRPGDTKSEGRSLFTSAGKYFRIQLKSAKAMSGKDRNVKEKKTAAVDPAVCSGGRHGVFSLSLCGSEDIWYDELFTMSFVRQPVGRLLELAAQDVHPPLYYLIVKAVLECVRLVRPAVNEVAAAKIVSVLPYLGLLAYSAVLVRKRDGWLCAGLLPFCLLSMPQLSNYTTEIRMYGWALFFLTAAFPACAGDPFDRKEAALGGFWLYGICAAYTHYFAAVRRSFFISPGWPASVEA